MSKNRWYLAHPFATRRRTREWELRIEATYGIELVNPFYDVDDRADVERIDAGRAERYAELIPAELVRRDLRHVLSANGTVAVVDGAISYGTIMEIVYSFMFGNPVYIICSNGHHQHPWLEYHATQIFASREDFESFLMEISNV